MENNTILCSNCGTENPDNFKFCSSCGSELIKKIELQVKTCPQCNSVFETESAFCGNCGTRLIVQQPEPEPEVVEEPTTVVCDSCGAENGIDFAFCASCGAKLQKPGMPKTCPTCGNECAPNTSFCPTCGTSMASNPTAQPNAQPMSQPVAQPMSQPVAQPMSQPVAQPVSQPSWQNAYQPAYQQMVPTQPKKARASLFSFDLKKLISCGILTILSLVLLLMSFAPVIKYTFKDEDTKERISLKVNAFDSIGFMFDNIRNQDLEEIADSKLYSRMEEVSESLAEADFDDLSRSDKKIISKYLKLSYKMNLRNEDTKLKPALFIAGAASITYVVLTLVALIHAALSLASVFTKTKTYGASCIKCFIIAPFMALIARSAFKSMELLSSAIGSSATKISSPVVTWGIIFASLLTLGTIAQKIIFEKKGFSLKNAIFNLVTIIIASVTIVLCSSNVMKATVKAQFENRDTESTVSVKINSSVYDFLKTTIADKEDSIESVVDGFKDVDDAKELKKQYVLNMISAYESYTVKEIKDGDANSVTNNVLFWCAVIGGNTGLISVFSLAPLFLLIAVIFASLTAAFAFTRIVTDEGPAKNMRVFAIFCVISTAIAFCLNFLFVLTIKRLLTTVRLTSTFKLGLASGIIALVIFSVLLLISTSLNKKKSNRTKRTAPRNINVNSWGERMEMSRF